MVTNFDEIVALVDDFDPTDYGRTRNYKDGAVSRLSPYISRGVISTRFVLERMVAKFKDIDRFEKFIQELVWRDHWQRNWQILDIDQDILQTQQRLDHTGIPVGLQNLRTGINAIDKGIAELYETGYMHNHMRMYVASVSSNVGRYHWRDPARWMYYHLLDGDWGSNALSWQWVAGTNSGKLYYANQENINKFFYDDQKNTFLDCSYEDLSKLEVPKVLKESISFNLKTKLPETNLMLDITKPIVLYTTYNLDPNWLPELDANRILILDPKHFDDYPISDNVMAFILCLSQNISGLQIFVGSFAQLKDQTNRQSIHFKEHPFSSSFTGVKHEREWIAPEVKAQSSFFKYWKQVSKQLLQ